MIRTRVVRFRVTTDRPAPLQSIRDKIFYIIGTVYYIIADDRSSISLQVDFMIRVIRVKRVHYNTLYILHRVLPNGR